MDMAPIGRMGCVHMKKKAANLRIPPKYVDKTTGLEKTKTAAETTKKLVEADFVDKAASSRTCCEIDKTG